MNGRARVWSTSKNIPKQDITSKQHQTKHVCWVCLSTIKRKNHRSWTVLLVFHFCLCRTTKWSSHIVTKSLSQLSQAYGTAVHEGKNVIKYGPGGAKADADGMSLEGVLGCFRLVCLVLLRDFDLFFFFFFFFLGGGTFLKGLFDMMFYWFLCFFLGSWSKSKFVLKFAWMLLDFFEIV